MHLNQISDILEVFQMLECAKNFINFLIWGKIKSKINKQNGNRLADNKIRV